MGVVFEEARLVVVVADERRVVVVEEREESEVRPELVLVVTEVLRVVALVVGTGVGRVLGLIEDEGEGRPAAATLYTEHAAFPDDRAAVFYIYVKYLVIVSLGIVEHLTPEHRSPRVSLTSDICGVAGRETRRSSSEDRCLVCGRARASLVLIVTAALFGGGCGIAGDGAGRDPGCVYIQADLVRQGSQDFRKESMQGQ